MKWTDADQAELDALNKRKREFHETHFRPVEKMVREIFTKSAPDEVAQIARWLIAHAEDVRKALVPFDTKPDVRSEP